MSAPAETFEIFDRRERFDLVAKEARYFLWILRQSPLMLIGLIIVGGVILLVPLAPVLAPFPPETANGAAYLQAPSGVHWLGTDRSGMDILSRIIYAPRIDLTIAMAATAISILIGTPLGVIAGYFSERKGVGGKVSELILRLMDIVQAFPVFILAMALVAAAGSNLANVIYALAFVNAPIYVRLMRSQVLSVREKRFVEAARCVGNSDFRIMFKHVLPNSLGPVFIQVSVTIGWAILLTAGLSYIGAGVKVPTPEWGSMISVGAPEMMTGQWWSSVFPGITLGITVLGFALLGDGLSVFFDPTQRK